MSDLVDIVIPVYADVALTEACILSVLQHACDALGRIIIVNDCGPDVRMLPMLKSLRRKYDCIRILENECNRSVVSSDNRGIFASERDVVVLNSDTEVTPGWLQALVSLAERYPSVAAISPRSNNAGICTFPDEDRPLTVDEFRRSGLSLAEQPELILAPTAVSFCLWMRRTAIQKIGAFDPAYGRGYHDENDWCQRARRHGYDIGIAGRVLVYHYGGVSFGKSAQQKSFRNEALLLHRFPRFHDDAKAFREGTFTSSRA